MRYLSVLLVLSMAACAGDDNDCVGNDCVCTDAGACEIDCGDQCNAICERSDVCSSSCGDDCDLVCRDADRCDGVCGDGCFATCERLGTCVIDCGEDCDVLCSVVDDCDVSLTTGSVTCDSSQCTITCQTGGVVDCGGNRFACDPSWC